MMPLLVLLLLLLLLSVPVALCQECNNITFSPTPPLAITLDDLFQLCKNDSICRARFHLGPSPVPAQGPEYELFVQLFGMLLSEDGGASPDQNYWQAFTSQTAADWWWLALLRKAKFCRPNEEYVFGIGCRCAKNRKKLCNEIDPSEFAWDHVTLTIIAVLLIVAIMWKSAELLSRIELLHQQLLGPQPKDGREDVLPQVQQSQRDLSGVQLNL